MFEVKSNVLVYVAYTSAIEAHAPVYLPSYVHLPVMLSWLEGLVGPGHWSVVHVAQENSFFGCAADAAPVGWDPQVWVMTVMYDIMIRDYEGQRKI